MEHTGKLSRHRMQSTHACSACMHCCMSQRFPHCFKVSPGTVRQLALLWPTLPGQAGKRLEALFVVPGPATTGAMCAETISRCSSEITCARLCQALRERDALYKVDCHVP